MTFYHNGNGEWGIGKRDLSPYGFRLGAICKKINICANKNREPLKIFLPLDNGWVLLSIC